MNPLKNTSILAVGTVLVAAGVILSASGRGTPLVSIYAITALLLTFIAIWVNTYRTTSSDQPMGRLLHDPELPVASANGGGNAMGSATAMTPEHASTSVEVLTAEERWRRWEQRGVENDARVKRHFQHVFAGLFIVAGLLLGWAGTR